MAHSEIEIKFVVNRPALSVWDEQLRSALNKVDFEVLGTEQSELENTYYDSQSLFFEQHKMGMRVRGKNNKFEQTIKSQTAVDGGLHQRKEFNVELANATPDLTLFPDEVWPKGDIERPQTDELVTQFTTHFTRFTVHLKHHSGECELVFDQGEINTEDTATPLNEIEIELLSGEPKLLLELANLLVDKGVRLSDASKAQQGYEQLHGVPNKATPLPTYLILPEQVSTEDVFCLGCQTALTHWQQHEHLFFTTESTKMLAEIQASIRLLLQSLSLFLPILQCQPMLELQRKVLAFSEKWWWVDDLQSTRFLLSKKGPFHKTISRQEALVSYIQGRQTGLMSSQQPDVLLFSKQATEIKLAVVSLLLERPWHNYHTTGQQPVVEYAKGWLSQGRQTILQSLQSPYMLPALNYIAVEATLRQTLFNGFLLSNLFAHSESVRAPWLDLLIGIDEIRALMFLKQALKDDDLEFEEGMIEWVDEKINHLLQVMERTRQVGLKKDIYW